MMEHPLVECSHASFVDMIRSGRGDRCDSEHNRQQEWFSHGFLLISWQGASWRVTYL